MNRILDRLLALGTADVRIVAWEDAPPKGDAADFPGDAGELRELLAAATLVDALADPNAEPVDLAGLLDGVRAMITKYVVLTDPQADAVTLWTAHTHAIDAADTTPYENVNSAEKQSGKTRLLEVQELLVRKPWKSDHASAAALYRKVEKDCPTLLLDESDAAFKGDKEHAETLRGVPTAKNPIPSQPPASVVAPRSPRLLVFELRSLSLQEVGDLVEGRRNPTRIELYVADKRVDTGKSLDVHKMKDETLKSFVDGEHKAILGSFDDGFTPFQLRVEVIDIDESSSDPKPPLLGRFVWTIIPSDIGQEMRPAGSFVEYYGDDNVMLAVRINWLEAD